MESFLTPASVSEALVAMIEQAQASVVQVHSGERGIGTGVIWRSNGSGSEVITNAHVVAGHGRNAGRAPIRIVTTAGRELDAMVSATNAQLDLAMLGVAAGDLPVAKISDSSQLRIGEWVFAIGNPWGQVGVVTSGIVSGMGSIVIQGTDRRAHYIRSDVLLAPGNSGGPLLNAKGAVVGINAMIFGGDLSVAIPSRVAMEWLAIPQPVIHNDPANMNFL
jgi:serine protease Do